MRKSGRPGAAAAILQNIRWGQMVRTGRPRRARARVWSEIGVSAGVLLVPPLLIGGAVYGLLPAHDDGAARSSAVAIESLPADFNSRSAFDTGVDEPPPA